MKTLHVQTKKVTSHNSKGEPNFEELVLKLGEFKPFDNFVKHLFVSNYSSVNVIGYFDSLTGKNGDDVDVLSQFQYKIDQFINNVPEVVTDYKALSEKLSKENEALDQRLSNLENIIKQNNKTSEEPSEEDARKSALREEIRALGGKSQGLKTIESLSNRLEELKEQ